MLKSIAKLFCPSSKKLADGFKTIRDTLPKIPVAHWNEALPVLYDDWGLC